MDNKNGDPSVTPAFNCLLVCVLVSYSGGGKQYTVSQGGHLLSVVQFHPQRLRSLVEHLA